MARLDEKVVFIAGGASGVGRACAELVVREGGRVVIADLDAAKGERLVEALGSERALFIRHDVSSESDWDVSMTATLKRFGRLDGLVNCAAMFAEPSLEETSLELWRRIMHVNADGAFLACRAAVRAMKEKGGAIVNIVSTAALAGHEGMCAYSASKGAVAALTRNVATHCRENGMFIRCNAIVPGGIKTEMTEHLWKSLPPAMTDIETSPKAGFCEPVDVANAAIYLLSHESRFVNGCELRVDNALLTAIA